MPRLYTVLRPVTVQGVTYDAGALVDASGWRTLRQLVALRRLAPAESDVAVPVTWERRPGAPEPIAIPKTRAERRQLDSAEVRP